MDETTTETVSETPANGSVATVKPWIAAGYKSRDEWRKAKGQKTGKKSKAKVHAVAKSAAKKTTKPKRKRAKVKAKHAAKVSSRKKPALPGKGAVKDGSLKPVPLAECSPNVRKVLLAVKPGKTALLSEIEAMAFPNLPHKKASSRVRNQLRFLRVHKMFRMVGDGKYRRVA